MFKFFAYGFFTLNLVFFAFLLVGNDLLFEHNYLWVFLFLYLLMYGGFVFLTLLNLFFTLKKFSIVEKLKNMVGGLSQTTIEIMTGVESVLYFTIIVIAAGFLFYSGGMLAVNEVFARYKETMKTALYALTQGDNSLERDIEKLQTNITNLQRDFEAKDAEEYLSRNKPYYLYSDDKYEYMISFNGIRFLDTAERVAHYDFRIRRLDDGAGDFVALRNSADYYEEMSGMTLTPDDTVNKFTAKRYELDDFTQPVFLLSLETDYKTAEIIAYPLRSNTSETIADYEYFYYSYQTQIGLPKYISTNFRSSDVTPNSIEFDLYINNPYDFDLNSSGGFQFDSRWKISADSEGKVVAEQMPVLEKQPQE